MQVQRFDVLDLLAMNLHRLICQSLSRQIVLSENAKIWRTIFHPFCGILSSVLASLQSTSMFKELTI